MKTNYKVTDKVTISKPGLFDGFSGEVIGNNPDIKNSLSVMVNLTGSNILWNFAYSDILQTKDNASHPAKTSDNPKPEIVKDVVEILEKVGFEQVKQKRQYRKKDKTEVKVTKIKRAYVKRK